MGALRKTVIAVGCDRVLKPRSPNGYFIALSMVPNQVHTAYCVPLKQISVTEDLIKRKYHYHRGKKKWHK